MTISSASGSRTDPRLDERFIDLICADDALMRAEFDAIVAEEWSILPPCRRASSGTDQVRRRARGGQRPSSNRAPADAGRRVPAGTRLVFARSPPEGP
ncbi:hypothetical protein [Microbacterium sp. 22242]|uniref:hypothetical protein n=1 Tax=Microbacterium sp. 22242 TaxID=3453896 RepID=UPI003F835D9C